MHNKRSSRQVKILGLPFCTLPFNDLVAELASGGLLVAPAAPALASMPEDPAYRDALASATWIIPDSGFMVLIWNLFNTEKIQRCSGLKLFRALIDHLQTCPETKLFLINPNAKQSQTNQQWLKSKNLLTLEQQHYNAPHYIKRPIADPQLLEIIDEQKPSYILINLGGGTQEILGQYLSENLNYNPTILCTGAAIAFLTGQQANIPVWADKFYLGWLFRIASSPTRYLSRYFKALKLLPLMLNSSK